MKFCFFGSSYFSLNFLYFLFTENINLIFIFLCFDKFYRNKLNLNIMKLYCKKYNILFFQFKLKFIINNFNIFNRYYFENIKKLKFLNVLICDYSFCFSYQFHKYYNIINIHGSLLPIWNGPAPFKFSYVFGNFISLTFIFINNYYDNGNILYFKKTPLKFFYNYCIIFFKLFNIYINFKKIIFRNNLLKISFRQKNLKIFCKKNYFNIN